MTQKLGRREPFLDGHGQKHFEKCKLSVTLANPSQAILARDGRLHLNFMKFRANYLPAGAEHKDGVEFLRSDAMQALIERLKNKFADVCRTGIEPSSDYLARNLIPHTRCEPATAYGAIIETKDGPILDVASQTVNTVLGQNDIWALANMNAFNLSGYPSFLSSRFSNVYAELLAEQLATVGGIESAGVNHRICSGAAAVESLLTNAWNYRCNEYGDRSSRNLVGSFKGGFHG